MKHVIERVTFRLFHMECCGHQLCWVNPRVPMFCPQCGQHVYPDVRGWAATVDDTAEIHFHA